MNAYLPHDLGSVLLTFALAASCFIEGFVLPRIGSLLTARTAAWVIATAAVVTVERHTLAEPAGFRMGTIVIVLFLAMKAVVAVEARWAGTRVLTFREWTMFALGWPGMQPERFLSERRIVAQDERFRGETRRTLRHGLTCLAAGAALLALAVRLRSAGEILVAVLALAGLSLVLHFGLFDVLTAWWRSQGVPCRPPFQDPIRSTSLREFWGKRWNLPFVEMIALAVYRPLGPLVGRPLAGFVSFCFSGLLHELAISAPVRDGWGRPFLYFVVQGLALAAEERLSRSAGWRRLPGPFRRAVTILVVVAPAPLLFHGPFVRGVIEPLVGFRPGS